MKKAFYLYCLTIIFFYQTTQAQQFGMGLEFNDAAYQEVPVKSGLLTRDYEALPKAYSLKKYCPKPQTQGMYATCVGWSSAYAARTIIDARQKNLTDTEEITKQAFSGAFVYRLIRLSEDSTCQYGTFIHDALSIMQSRGVPKYTQFNPLCPSGTVINEDIAEKAQSYKIKDFHRLFNSDDSDDLKIRVLKKSLSQGNPVVFAMLCPNSFYKAKDFWQPDESESPYNRYGGHAMCIVGYDDEKYADEGAFEIMNSWGNQWGNQGFIWIKYSTFAAYAKYAFEMFPFEAKDPVAYDLSGEVKLIDSKGKNLVTERIKNNTSLAYYQMKEPLHSGDRFRIYISNHEPAYVYAIGSDLSKEIYPLFPHKKGISAALNYSSNHVAIPGEDYYIEIDQNVGTDYLCVLYSKEPLDFQKLSDKLRKTPGSFEQQIQTLLADKILNPQATQFDSQQMAFKAKSGTRSVAAFMVEIAHQ
ncbi:MAG: DUF4384 domain-containing protein [Microscillaceae bacterium]|nr:DUF4384 domain-containing protein [Microscillaceae bacterium]